MCHYCHRVWHESPLDAYYWFDEKFGEARRMFLTEKMHNRVKVSKLEEKDIKKHYAEQLKLIESKRSEGVQGYIDFVSYQ